MPLMIPAAWHGDGRGFLSLQAAEQDGGGVIAPLQAALPRGPALDGCYVALDVRLLRLRTRIDAVLVTGGAVISILARPGAGAFLSADRFAAEDAALDLADFHAGCRGVPVLPVLLVPHG